MKIWKKCPLLITIGRKSNKIKFYELYEGTPSLACMLVILALKRVKCKRFRY